MRTESRAAMDRTPVRMRRARRSSRGQALVEFAMVVPLFLLMMFGFIEIALITASLATYNFAAKDAARLGALVGPTNPTGTPVDNQIVNLIKSRTSGIVVAKLVEIEIYKSDAGGDYILPGNSAPVEDAYDANGNLIGTAGWPASSRNDTLLDADYLGIRVTFNYTYLTSYLSGSGSTLQLIANSVQRIEPQDYQSWKAPSWLAMVHTSRSYSAGPAALFGGGALASVVWTPETDVRRQSRGGAA